MFASSQLNLLLLTIGDMIVRDIESRGFRAFYLHLYLYLIDNGLRNNLLPLQWLPPWTKTIVQFGYIMLLATWQPEMFKIIYYA